MDCESIPLSVSGVEEIGDRVLVVFDGHCGLCNRAVRWFLRRDGRDRLRFVASESEKVAGLLERLGVVAASGLGPGSILVVMDAGGASERLLVRSEAIVALLGELPEPWPGFGMVLGWIPRVMCDLGYRLIARWRYRIWGRMESCPLPTAEERARFL
jgi:predicted DCC family thiol-disulfide oxidoreductase YuxK